MIMDLFSMAGWRAISVGARMPIVDLAHAARDFNVEVVTLSATLVTHLAPLRDAIEAVRATAPGVKVLVGGLAFAGAPEAWQQVGADGYAPRAQEAVSKAEELLR